MTVTYESYLCHHGVKGMKWGIRKDKQKFQYQSTVDPNYSGGKKYSLSSFTMETKQRYDEGKSKSYTWRNGKDFVGTVVIDTIPASDGYKWVGSLRITKKYRGHDLGNQIIEFVKSNGGGSLAVDTHNSVAKRLYEENGFEVDELASTSSYYIMRYLQNKYR